MEITSYFFIQSLPLSPQGRLSSPRSIPPRATKKHMWEHLRVQIEKWAIEPLYTSKFTQEGESKEDFCNRVHQATKKEFLWFD